MDKEERYELVRFDNGRWGVIDNEESNRKGDPCFVDRVAYEYMGIVTHRCGSNMFHYCQFRTKFFAKRLLDKLKRSDNMGFTRE